MLSLILPSPVVAVYVGGASKYEQCESGGRGIYSDSVPTLKDILECRRDVAANSNEARGISTQVLFDSPDYLDPANFSLISWVTFFLNIAIFLVIAYYIFLVIKAAVKIITSQGSPEKLAEGYNQLGSVLKSVAALFVFLLILVLVGNFLGIGAIWQWPKAFSQCGVNRDGVNEFYFTKQLRNPGQQIDC